MRQPLANVTGFFAVPVRKGSPVYLYIAPQASISTVLETVRKCPPIQKTAVEKDGSFSFPDYPSGDYIVIAQTEVFKEEVAYPVVETAESAGLQVRTLHEIRTSEYMATVVRLEPT